jgi:hypothetical protein
MLSDPSNDRPALTPDRSTKYWRHGASRRRALHPGSWPALRPQGDVILSTRRYGESIGLQEVLDEAKAGDVTIFSIALGGGFATWRAGAN